MLNNHLSEQAIYRKKKKQQKCRNKYGRKTLVDTIEYFHSKINYLYYKKKTQH